MNDMFSRTRLLLGDAAVEDLLKKHVAVFGIGGVGGYVCEALVRSGIGRFTLVDKDVVDITNLNRQIIATQSTVGRAKTEVMKERMLDINPSVTGKVRDCFFLPENADTFDFAEYDYVVDAVDTVTAKLCIIEKAIESGVPVISSMGAGNKLDASAFTVADIYATSVCPLAKVMRRELKKRGIDRLKVVYSKEPPRQSKVPAGEAGEDMRVSAEDHAKSDGKESSGKRSKVAPGSVAFVPAAAGLILAGEVVKELCKAAM